ncbi:MAG: DUF4249 domain-containing protein [Bacteroidetes bacterium]|nr:DUF4249 domain-containing protein [Bacteroidota bacterium]
MNKLLFSLLILLLATGCTERINVNLDNSYVRLVVDGGITNDSMQQSVILSKSASYFYNQPPPMVSHAIVTLTDGSFLDTLKEDLPNNPGIYGLAKDFRGVIGKTYSLDIKLPEVIGNNAEYTSSCKIMKVARLDSIQTEFNPDLGKNGHWLIKIYAQEPGDEMNFYLLKYYRNGVLMSDSIQKWSTSDDKYFNGSYIRGLTAFYINNSRTWETLHPGDTVMVQMSGITKEYYDFIQQVQQAGYQIPFFSGPPANVEGNISNGGIGFFTAYSNSFAKLIIPKK